MAPAEQTTRSNPDRSERRRAQTRAKLIAAAQALFARKGIDNTRIHEITEEADVGLGSFYYHFSSKDEIAEAVLSETFQAQGAAVRRMTERTEDPAEVVAIAFRYFVRRASTDPDWAWLLVRLDISPTVVLSALGPFAGADVQRHRA